MTAPPLEEQIEAKLATLPPSARARAEAKLSRELARRKALAEFRTPTQMARALGGPGVKVTPMLRMLDSVLVAADQGYRTRWIVNTPPQETKTTTINQWGALWLLLRDPTRRIGVASYEQGIAARSGLAVKQLIETHGGGYWGSKPDPDRVDRLGLQLDPSRSKTTAWSLAGIDPELGPPGSMLSVGIGSALTGRPLNVLIIDDPLKDDKQASSPVYRERAKEWYRGVATTRLSGRTIVIVVQTRWHEDDLSGWLLTQDALRANPRWSRLIVPAQAEEDDALGRAPGEFLESVQGRDLAEWEEKRSEVGERVWFAMYQQRPTPPGGGVFHRAWFERFRSRPGVEIVQAVTWVDPADNGGDGDEAGVITGGVGADGNVYILEDNSQAMTVARWFRVAFLAALRHQCSAVKYEQSLSQLRVRARQAWKDLRRQTKALWAFQRDAVRAEGGDPDKVPWPKKGSPEVLAEVIEYLAREDDTEVEKRGIEAELVELWPYVPQVMSLPPTGPPVSGHPAKGTKSYRATMVAPMFEQGHARLAGFFPTLENQCVTWRESQDSPDRMDAMVHLATDLGARMNQTIVKGGADADPTYDLPQRLHRAPTGGVTLERYSLGQHTTTGRWRPTPAIERSTR